MLGFADGWVAAAFWLCILSSVLCVVYGALNWNKGDQPTTSEDRQWAREDDRVEAELP